MADLIAYLVSKGVVGFLAMDTAVQHMRRVGGRLTSSILDTTDTPPDQLLQAAAECFGMGYASDALLASIDPDVPQFWHHDNALRLGAMPISVDSSGLVLGVLEPLSHAQLDEIKEEYGNSITQLLMLEFRFFELCHRFFGVVLDHRYAIWASKYPLDDVEPLAQEDAPIDESSPFFVRENFDQSAPEKADQRNENAPTDPSQLFGATSGTAAPRARVFEGGSGLTEETEPEPSLQDDAESASALFGEAKSAPSSDELQRQRDATTGTSAVITDQALAHRRTTGSVEHISIDSPRTQTVETQRGSGADGQNTGEVSFLDHVPGPVVDPAIAEALLGTEESFHAAFDFGGDVGWRPTGNFTRSAAERKSLDREALARIPTDVAEPHNEDSDDNAGSRPRPLTTAPQLPLESDASPSPEFSEEDSAAPYLQSGGLTRHDSLDPVIHNARRHSIGMEPVRAADLLEALPSVGREPIAATPSSDGTSASGLHPLMARPSQDDEAKRLSVHSDSSIRDATGASLDLARRLGLIDAQGSWTFARRELDALSEQESSISTAIDAVDIRGIFQSARSINELLYSTLKYFGAFFERRFFMHFWHPRRSSGLLMQGVRDNTTAFSNVEVPYDESATVYKMRQTSNYLQGSPIEIGFQTLYSRLGIEKANETIVMPITVENDVVMILLMDNGPNRDVGDALRPGEIALILQQLSQALTMLAARGEASKQKHTHRATPLEGTAALPDEEHGLAPAALNLPSPRLVSRSWSPEELVGSDLLDDTSIPANPSTRLEAAMDSMELQTVDADETDHPRLDSVEYLFKRGDGSTTQQNPSFADTENVESGSFELPIRPDEELSASVKALLDQDTQRSDKRAVGIIISDDERSADDLANDLFPPTHSELMRLQAQQQDANVAETPIDRAQSAPLADDDTTPQPPADDPFAINASEEPPAKTGSEAPLSEAAQRRAAISASKKKSQWKARDLARLLNVGSVEIHVADFLRSGKLRAPDEITGDVTNDLPDEASFEPTTHVTHEESSTPDAVASPDAAIHQGAIETPSEPPASDDAPAAHASSLPEFSESSDTEVSVPGMDALDDRTPDFEGAADNAEAFDTTGDKADNGVADDSGSSNERSADTPTSTPTDGALPEDSTLRANLSSKASDDEVTGFTEAFALDMAGFSDHNAGNETFTPSIQLEAAPSPTGALGDATPARPESDHNEHADAFREISTPFVSGSMKSDAEDFPAQEATDPEVIAQRAAQLAAILEQRRRPQTVADTSGAQLVPTETVDPFITDSQLVDSFGSDEDADARDTLKAKRTKADTAHQGFPLTQVTEKRATRRITSGSPIARARATHKEQESDSSGVRALRHEVVISSEHNPRFHSKASSPSVILSAEEAVEAETLMFAPQHLSSGSISPPLAEMPPPPPQVPAQREEDVLSSLMPDNLDDVLEEVNAAIPDVQSVVEQAAESLVSEEALADTSPPPVATLMTLDDLTEAQRRAHTKPLDAIHPTLEVLLYGDRSASDEALALLRAVPAHELPSIVADFPGPLLLNRRDVEEEHAPLNEHGPLLALADARLHDYLPQIWSCLERRSSDARYYALRFLALIRDLEWRYVLLEAVFDEDVQVQRLALRLLETQRNGPDFLMALETLRARTKAPVASQREVAMMALTQLRDNDGLDALIERLSDEEPQVRQRAREGLMRLTFIDCGDQPEAWQTWQRLHGRALPEQWLVDAMAAIEPLRRELAARALEKVPGLVLNYHPEMSNQALLRAKMTAERFFGLRR